MMVAERTVAEVVTPGRFGCPVCTHRAETVGDKRRHMKSAHSVSGNQKGGK